MIVQPFVSKLSVAVHYHEPQCLARRLVCCLHGQLHSEGLYNQITTFHCISCGHTVTWQSDLQYYLAHNGAAALGVKPCLCSPPPPHTHPPHPTPTPTPAPAPAPTITLCRCAKFGKQPAICGKAPQKTSFRNGVYRWCTYPRTCVCVCVCV